VVVTSFGGCPEVVQGGGGFVANPFHVEEFAEAIARLLRDPELRAETGRAGRARVESYFTIERLTDEFLEEYELARAAAQRGLASSASR
jgi:glycosyltransferase involved in cell wall biosynthesis